MIILFFTIPLIFIASYIALVILVHDLKCSTKHIQTHLNIRENYKVLSIFPHPDDEIMAAGGLLYQFSHNPNIHIKHVSVTKGENGNEITKLCCDDLGKLRSRELGEALGVIGIKDYEVWDYPDGNVNEQVDKLAKQIKKLISEFNPDVILTFEKRGLYGHPDHVVLSKIIHEIHIEERNNFKVLYATLPEKMLELAKLPTFMAKDKNMKSSLPEFKINVWKALISKYRAAKKYKSQRLNHGAPLFLKILVEVFEYYTTKFD